MRLRSHRFGDPPVLQAGSTGDAVTQLQTDLGLAGASYAVAVDGTFGDSTTSAVIQFQADNGLAQTGVVDAGTWNAIAQVAPMATIPTALPAAPQPASGPVAFVQALTAAPATAARAVVAPTAPSWVLPVVIGAFSVGGLLVVGGAAWWAVKAVRRPS